MASSATVLEDSSLLSRLDRALLPLEKLLALLSGVAAFSLMFLAAYSVAGREFFASPLLGYVDLIEALMPLIAIMGVSYVQREGGHIRMDILDRRFPGARAVVVCRRAFGGADPGADAGASGRAAWFHFDRSFDCARPLCSRDSSIDISLPLWPSKILMPIGLCRACACGWCLQVWGYASRAVWC